MIEPGDNDWNMLEEMINRLGVSAVTDAVERLSDDTSPEFRLGHNDDAKTVEVVLINRKGSESSTKTVNFTTMEQLRKDVELLVNQSSFYKLTVELTASWESTVEEEAELRKIEVE